MTRFWLCLLVAASLVPAVFAADDDLPRVPTHTHVVPGPTAAPVEVADVTLAQATQLMDQLASVATGPAAQLSMDQLLALHGELARQTQAYKKAYQSALGGAPAAGRSEDVNALFDEVIVGRPGDQAAQLARIAAAYEVLYTQFGQLMNARFLAGARGGIATYGSHETARSDVAEVAQASEQRLAVYQSHIQQALAQLKPLVTVDPAQR